MNEKTYLKKTEGNQLISLIRELIDGVEFDRVIELGNQVSEILDKYNREFKDQYNVCQGVFYIDT